MILRALSLVFALALGQAGASTAAFGASEAKPWRGKINGYDAYLPDLAKPARAAFINISPVWLPDDEPNWRSVAAEFNSIQLDLPLTYFDPEGNAKKILDALQAAARKIPNHPEIENLNVVLFGFSAAAAAAGRTASSPLLSNPDSRQPPQRVLAVIGVDEIDQAPYQPPASVPQLFLSDPGDGYGGLLTDVEDSNPKITHDAFARDLATKAGAPLTLISQPGHWHGGSVYGYRHRIDFRFLRVWLEEVLKLRLPATPPLAGPALAPDWRNHAGWLGTYDVAVKTSTQPWGDSERMVSVATSPRENYHDPRPFIWLPSERAADVWRTYAVTGDMPSLTPDRPMTPLGAFIRPGPDPTAKVNDEMAAVSSDPTGGQPSPPAHCRLGGAGGDAAVLVAFDRAIKSGEAASEGVAAVNGPPEFWSNVMIIKLKSLAAAGQLKLSLGKLVPADGGQPVEATVTASCR